MANLASPLRIGARGSSWLMSQQVYHFNTTSGSPLYLHFKTNVLTSVEKIFMIEAEGYNYGTGTPILAAWGLYTTGASSNTVSSKGLQSISGLTADGIYKSSDGYACIRAYNSSSHYYTGFTLHVYSSYYYTPDTVAITSATQTSNSGSYY